jgi:hypothetical protein
MNELSDEVIRLFNATTEGRSGLPPALSIHTVSGTNMMTARNGDAFVCVQDGARKRGAKDRGGGL